MIGIRRRILGGLFGMLYGPGACIYDRLAAMLFVGEWRRWQATALNAIPPGGIVVELGAGTGDLASMVAEKFDVWIGIERSRRMIGIARVRQHPPRLAFVQANAALLPIGSGLADAVIATFPSNYIFEIRVLDEVRRVLKLNGRLVVVLSGELAPDGIRRRLARWLLSFLETGTRLPADTTITLQGFSGVWSWHQTAHGRALVFAGSPDFTPVDGCSPRTGDVAERE